MRVGWSEVFKVYSGATDSADNIRRPALNQIT